jgi:hypothetical protein
MFMFLHNRQEDSSAIAVSLVTMTCKHDAIVWKKNTWANTDLSLVHRGAHTPQFFTAHITQTQSHSHAGVQPTDGSALVEMENLQTSQWHRNSKHTTHDCKWHKFRGICFPVQQCGASSKHEAISYQGEVPRTGNIRSLACRKERSGRPSNTLIASGLNPCLLDATSVDLLDTRICCTNEQLADASATARSHRRLSHYSYWGNCFSQFNPLNLL